MERKAILAAFWRAVAAQEKDPLREFFAEGAEVLWPNTNERFAVEEYLRANCEYPGKWHGKIEKMLDTAEGGHASLVGGIFGTGDLVFSVAGREDPAAGGILER